MINTFDLSFHVGNKKILDRVNTSFNPGEITMIVGPNGAGKSTLIKLLSQQIPPSHGSVKYDNIEVTRKDLPQLATLRSVLSQNIELAFPLTVEEVVMMGRYPHFASKPRSIDEEIVQKALEYFKVDAYKSENYLHLSGGEKQRVHFARVAAQIWPEEPSTTKYLLLDEPLTYLDVYFQYEFMNLVKDLMKEQPMVVVGVVHDLNLANRYGDKIILINKGKVTAHGLPNEVFTTENIENTFKVKPHFFKDAEGNSFISF